MSDDEPQAPQHPPLDYRPGDEDRKEKFAQRRDIIGGIVLGFIVIGFLGIVSGITVLNVPASSRMFSVLGVIFLFLSLGFVAMMGRKERRWGLMGFLIGASLGSLLQGLCFLVAGGPR